MRYVQVMELHGNTVVYHVLVIYDITLRSGTFSDVAMWSSLEVAIVIVIASLLLF